MKIGILVLVFMLAGCGGNPFVRPVPQCQIVPPSPNLIALCPLEMAPPLPDGKAGSLLLSHQAARQTYDECRVIHGGLVQWTNDVVTRCVKQKKE